MPQQFEKIDSEAEAWHDIKGLFWVCVILFLSMGLVIELGSNPLDELEWQEAVAPLIEEQRGAVFVTVDELTPEDVIEVRDMYLAYETAERERFERECKVTDWRERAKWHLPECIDYARAHMLIL